MSNLDYKDDIPKMAGIVSVKDETPSIKSFVLKHSMEYSAGQFVMVWLPGQDEKPLAVTKNTGKEIEITVEKKGRFTEKMMELKKGDKIGVRGPYGHGFETRGVKKACIVAGGLGAVPLMQLLEELESKKAKIDFVLGARNKENLLFEKRIGKKTNNLYITTDDGCAGRKGYCTDVLSELLSEKKYDEVYCCGPEPMMVKVLELCREKKQHCQLSLERYMKCAIGLCGQCVVDGQRVCMEGPVFGSEKVSKLKEFGKTARLKDSSEVSLKEYFSWREK
jgi:dihydroorotate dehydrogenase electron transfer subunit